MKINTNTIEHLKEAVSKLETDTHYDPRKPVIVIVSNEQKLYLIKHHQLIKHYPISTAKAGLGNQNGSYKTPLGIHQISEKIGSNAPLGSIFKARINTHKIAKILIRADETSHSDNVTTRILWLSGTQEGFNKGGDIDSHKRYIYIHGTDEEGRLGQKVSHGCIRMANLAIIELFDLVETGTLVFIN